MVGFVLSLTLVACIAKSYTPSFASLLLMVSTALLVPKVALLKVRIKLVLEVTAILVGVVIPLIEKSAAFAPDRIIEFMVRGVVALWFWMLITTLAILAILPKSVLSNKEGVKSPSVIVIPPLTTFISGVAGWVPCTAKS